MRYVIAMVFCFGLSTAADVAHCNLEQAKYAELNRPLVIRTAEEARLYPSLEQQATDRLRNYITSEITKHLNEPAGPATLVERIRCIQAGISEYSRLADITNTPITVPFHPAAGISTLAVAFELYRGGEGVPSVSPLLQVYAKRGRRLAYIGEVGQSFTGYTFYVYPIHAGKRGQTWFF